LAGLLNLIKKSGRAKRLSEAKVGNRSVEQPISDKTAWNIRKAEATRAGSSRTEHGQLQLPHGAVSPEVLFQELGRQAQCVTMYPIYRRLEPLVSRDNVLVDTNRCQLNKIKIFGRTGLHQLLRKRHQFVLVNNPDFWISHQHMETLE
jgi:hypothetical protein